jgi:hypothetical protein
MRCNVKCDGRKQGAEAPTRETPVGSGNKRKIG